LSVYDAPDPPLPPFKAKDAVIAYDEVPNNQPVIPFVTFNDPVTTLLFKAMTPFLATNSFGIYIVF